MCEPKKEYRETLEIAANLCTASPQPPSHLNNLRRERDHLIRRLEVITRKIEKLENDPRLAQAIDEFTFDV